MNKSTKISIATFSIIMLQSSVLACTIFSANDGTNILAGDNGDHSDPDTYIVFYPEENGKHGRVYCGWKQFWWQTGMNDEGLFFGSASTTFLEAQNSSSKPTYQRYLMYKCMEECSTVAEVLDAFNEYNLNFLETMQLLISDASGASAIIEGDTIYIKEAYYQVVTNFRLSQNEPPYPCERYNTAVNMFEQTEDISTEIFTNICDATHHHSYTQFSVVYDLQHKQIHLYNQHNYNNVRIFNLTDELAKGYHIYSIPSLFLISNPPSKPTKPSGSSQGSIGSNYTYSSMSIDTDEDQIYYHFDWGDGTNSSWLGPYVSGTTCYATHMWNQKNIYQVKVIAKDVNDAESEWSDPLPVSMPQPYSKYPVQFFNVLLKILRLFDT